MRILITTPYPPASQNGNSVSGGRICKILNRQGHQARSVAMTELLQSIPDTDLMIALNAKKCSPIPQSYKRQFPDRPLIVFLTGTDVHLFLNRENDDAAIVIENLQLADAIVVAQEDSKKSIPIEFAAKAVIVPKSIDIEVPKYQPDPNDKPLNIVSAFHFRTLKNPDQLVRLAERFTNEAELQFFGRVGDSDPEKRFLNKISSIPNLTWNGEVSRNEFLNQLSKAHIFLNTSLVEGGSNAVLEAMKIGVPVVATKIAGNTGLLGDKYNGYFQPNDDNGLFDLIAKFKCERFRDESIAAIKIRMPRFSYDSECRAWKALLQSLS